MEATCTKCTENTYDAVSPEAETCARARLRKIHPAAAAVQFDSDGGPAVPVDTGNLNQWSIGHALHAATHLGSVPHAECTSSSREYAEREGGVN